MTLREVYIAAQAIQERDHNHFAQLAALQGIQIPVKTPTRARTTKDELSTEDRAKAERTIAAAQKRVQERMRATNGHA